MQCFTIATHKALLAHVLLLALVCPRDAQTAARLSSAIWEEYPGLFEDFEGNLCEYGLSVAAEVVRDQLAFTQGAMASRTWGLARSVD